MNEQQEREAFEAWAEDGGLDLAKLSGGVYPDGAYADAEVRRDWIVWQARAALAANVPADLHLMTKHNALHMNHIALKAHADRLARALHTGLGALICAGSNDECQSLEVYAKQVMREALAAYNAAAPACTCPSGDGSLRWPCPEHPAPAPGAEFIDGDCVIGWVSQPRQAPTPEADHSPDAGKLVEAKPEAQQPLTDEQIEGGRSKLFSVGNPYCPITEKAMRTAVRWAERAHGIGASGEASNV